MDILYCSASVRYSDSGSGTDHPPKAAIAVLHASEQFDGCPRERPTGATEYRSESGEPYNMRFLRRRGGKEPRRESYEQRLRSIGRQIDQDEMRFNLLVESSDGFLL
ncbi:MAG: hypothetical protein WBW88_04005, partial [Rhodothermales bacterium]